jgi:hypothetical protein
MPANQASLDALAGATRTRSNRVDIRIDKAFNALRREGADITISSVARRAGVTRNSIHRRKDVVARIRAHRPLAAVGGDIAPASGGDTSIVAALRGRLTAKDNPIPELKAALRERDRTIAILHGRLDRLDTANHRP